MAGVASPWLRAGQGPGRTDHAGQGRRRAIRAASNAVSSSTPARRTADAGTGAPGFGSRHGCRDGGRRRTEGRREERERGAGRARMHRARAVSTIEPSPAVARDRARRRQAR